MQTGHIHTYRHTYIVQAGCYVPTDVETYIGKSPRRSESSYVGPELRVGVYLFANFGVRALLTSILAFWAVARSFLTTILALRKKLFLLYGVEHHSLCLYSIQTLSAERQRGLCQGLQMTDKAAWRLAQQKTNACTCSHSPQAPFKWYTSFVVRL